MSKAEAYFLLLAEQIPNAKLGKMFGALCIKMPNSKAAAMFWKDAIVVKLQGDSLQEAMSLDDTALFDPMGGKPMKEWVQVSYHYKDKWEMFARISAEGVEKLEKKVSGKGKK